MSEMRFDNAEEDRISLYRNSEDLGIGRPWILARI
jgi:hypothetical protein